MREAERAYTPLPVPAFVPIQLPAPHLPAQIDRSVIRIECTRPSRTVVVEWPVDQAQPCIGLFARPIVTIRIDEIWLATEPMDMRAGSDTALARVVRVFGEARPHAAYLYLFAHKRGNRMKVLIHDGLGLSLCSRRLYQGCFSWTET